MKTLRWLAVWVALPVAFTGCAGCVEGKWQRTLDNGHMDTFTFSELDKTFKEKETGEDGWVYSSKGTYVTRVPFLDAGEDQMDLNVTSGTQGASLGVWQCIYKVDGNTLTLATSPPGGVRPRNLAGGAVYTKAGKKDLAAGLFDGLIFRWLPEPIAR